MASAELVIAVVSLVIAVIAFWISVAQALQQYISTAEGYRKCAKAVVGPWVKYRKRTFEPSELRFVVTYATPVFFVAHPASTRCPLPKRAVHNLDGSPESRSNTYTSDLAHTLLEKRKSTFHRVGPTNDALASWVMLLYAFQDNEQSAAKWDNDMRLTTPAGTAIVAPDYTMCVQIQKVDRNWDFMPDSITKPYATTTLVHIAEIAVMLGMSWRTFEPDTGDLSAESDNIACNGFLVPGSGLVVTFTVTGEISQVVDPPHHTVPDIRVKLLIFGTVPSIFDTKSRSGAAIPLLNFGSQQALRETLDGFVFSQEESDRYLAYEPRARAINFEVISMIGQVFRIRGSSFRRLPNPNTGPWVDSFDSCELMREFQTNLASAKLEEQCSQVSYIQAQWKEVLATVWKDREEEIDIVMREAVHDVIEECDEFLHFDDEVSRVVIAIQMHFLLKQLEKSRSSLATHPVGPRDRQVDVLRRETTAEMLEVLKAQLEHSMLNLSDFLDIWLMLRFRGCLWWTLHEFDQADTRALNPRWQRSRMPVMIL